MILGIKTAGEAGELVLFDAKRELVVGHRKLTLDSTLSEKILPLLDKLLTSYKLLPTDLQAIVIYSGPGSFTSLRVGHSVANTLAMALDIPLAGLKESEIRGSFAESVFETSKKARKNVTLVPFYGKKPHITKPKKRA